MFRRGFILALASISMACFAQVYKHVDEDGNVTFTDKPPANSEEIQIREPNSLVPPPTIDRSMEADGGDTSIPMSYQVKITAPADESVIPRGPGNFSVSASIQPSLRSGSKLQLLIDGVEEGEPQRNTTWALSNVYRGTRKLAVAILDARGKEVARSEEVTIYVFRPSKNF